MYKYQLIRSIMFLVLILNFSSAEQVKGGETVRRVITVASDGVKGQDADYIGISGLQEAIRSVTDGSDCEIRLSGLFEGRVGDFIDCPIDHQKAIIPEKKHLIISGNDRNKDGIIVRFPDDLDISYRNFNILVSGVTMTLKNLNLTVKNLRYPIHIYGGSAKDQNFTVENCIISHEGNSGKAQKDWPYPRPFGVGLSSGFRFTVKNSYVYSEQITPINHGTNTTFSTGAHVIYENTQIKCAAKSALSVWLYAQGSAVLNTIELNNVSLEAAGDVGIGEGVWTPGSLEQQVADHNEFELRMTGIPPRPYRCSTKGLALRIESSSNSKNSSVRFDENSDAFAMIVGNPQQKEEGKDRYGFKQQYGYSYRDGGDGLAAFAMGSISLQENPLTYHKGKYISSLGKRLGDCSKTPKILAVVIDGKRREIIFNKNYNNTDEFHPSASNNAEILAEIASQIAPDALVSLYDPACEYYPEFKGLLRLKNHDQRAVKAGMGIVFTSDGGFRRALNKDGKIDGICLDDGRINDTCRIITEGEIWSAATKHRFSVLEKTADTRRPGDELGISVDMPGVFAQDAKPGILSAVRQNVLQIKR